MINKEASHKHSEDITQRLWQACKK
jgi:hypothetical protein